MIPFFVAISLQQGTHRTYSFYSKLQITCGAPFVAHQQATYDAHRKQENAAANATARKASFQFAHTTSWTKAWAYRLIRCHHCNIINQRRRLWWWMINRYSNYVCNPSNTFIHLIFEENINFASYQSVAVDENDWLCYHAVVVDGPLYKKKGFFFSTPFL